MTNTANFPWLTLLTPSDFKLRFNTCKGFWLSDLSHPKHTRAARRDKTYSFNFVVFRSVINSRFVFRGCFYCELLLPLSISLAWLMDVLFFRSNLQEWALSNCFSLNSYIRTELPWLECFFLVLTLDLPWNQAYHATSALRPHCSRSCALNDVLKSCDIERCEIDFCCSQSSDHETLRLCRCWLTLRDLQLLAA